MDGLDLAMRTVVVLKGLNELLILTLLGQAALYLLAGRRRHDNLIYGVFNQVGSRVLRAFRRLMPAFVHDRLLPFVSMFSLLLLELLLIVAKISLFAGSALRG